MFFVVWACAVHLEVAALFLYPFYHHAGYLLPAVFYPVLTSANAHFKKLK